MDLVRRWGLILAVVAAMAAALSAEDESVSLPELHKRHAALVAEQARVEKRLHELSQDVPKALKALRDAGGIPYPVVPDFLRDILPADGDWYDAAWLRARIPLLRERAKAVGNRLTGPRASMTDSYKAKVLASEVLDRAKLIEHQAKKAARMKELAGYWELRQEDLKHVAVDLNAKVRVILRVGVLTPKAERPAGRYGVAIYLDGKPAHRMTGAWQLAWRTWHAVQGTRTLDGKNQRADGTLIVEKGTLVAGADFLPFKTRYMPDSCRFKRIGEEEGSRLIREPIEDRKKK